VFLEVVGIAADVDLDLVRRFGVSLVLGPADLRPIEV
jgi:hypothetical protein